VAAWWETFTGEKTCSANLADTERNERQAFKRQQFSAAMSEMAYHNHFVPNNLGGNPKSAMPFPSLQVQREVPLRHRHGVSEIAVSDMPIAFEVRDRHD
jgi:hypothetical protein